MTQLKLNINIVWMWWRGVERATHCPIVAAIVGWMHFNCNGWFTQRLRLYNCVNAWLIPVSLGLIWFWACFIWFAYDDDGGIVQITPNSNATFRFRVKRTCLYGKLPIAGVRFVCALIITESMFGQQWASSFVLLSPIASHLSSPTLPNPTR